MKNINVVLSRLLLSLVLLLVVLKESSYGDLTLAFDQSGAVVEFSVDVGATVEVPVYLIQTGEPIANGDLLTDGIVSMGIQLNYDSLAGSAIVTAAVQAAAFFEFQDSMIDNDQGNACLLYTSPSPRDQRGSRMPSSA